MTSTGNLHTYGIFSARPTVINLKKDKEIGWVADIKWAFATSAIRERKFQLEHMALLRSAVKADGIKVECTPMLDGTALDPVMVPTTQRGNITIGEEGEVVVTTRIVMDDLEERGLGVELLMKASNCLECTADEQQTLEESIQSELQTNREEDGQLEGQQTLEDAIQAEMDREKQLQADVDQLTGKGQDDVAPTPKKGRKNLKLDGEGAQA